MNVKSVLFTGAMIALVMIELIIAPKQSLLIAIVMTLGFLASAMVLSGLYLGSEVRK